MCVKPVWVNFIAIAVAGPNFDMIKTDSRDGNSAQVASRVLVPCKTSFLHAQICFTQTDPDRGLSPPKKTTKQVLGYSDTEFSWNHKVPEFMPPRIVAALEVA